MFQCQVVELCCDVTYLPLSCTNSFLEINKFFFPWFLVWCDYRVTMKHPEETARFIWVLKRINETYSCQLGKSRRPLRCTHYSPWKVHRNCCFVVQSVRFTLLEDNWSIIKDFPHFMMWISMLRFLSSADIHVSCLSHQESVHWLHHHAVFEAVPDKKLVTSAPPTAVCKSGDLFNTNSFKTTVAAIVFYSSL